MKLLKQIGIFFISALALSSCVDKDPDFQNFPDPDVDFTYNVDGDQYVLDYYVVSTIQFNNVSAKEGPITWNFGDGQTSNEPNPKHKYASAGLYKVTLTIEGVGSRTYSLLIYDIIPQLSVASQSTDTIEFNKTLVDFNLSLPNPENKIVRYVWNFPDGTTLEDGTPISTFEGISDAEGNVEYPGKVKFSNIGSQKIEIQAYFDTEGENRRLEDSYLNVQVGCSEPAATLYYAQRDGNIKALKLVDLSSLPAGTKVYPFDMGVNSGANPFNLLYADVEAEGENGERSSQGWIYILDPGKQYYYVNDESGTLGDGQITAMRTDGSGVNTVITNVGGPAFSDPFYGFVDKGKLYYTDRNTGISSIDLTTRGAVQPITQSGSTYQRANYYVVNNLIPYYGRGIVYGAISTGLYRDKKGTWWWSKNYNGYGIFRFKESDIYPTEKEATSKPLPYPVVLEAITMKAFAIDEDRNFLYFWRMGSGEGFYCIDLPDDNGTGKDAQAAVMVVKSFNMEADPINTTDAEKVTTTQFAIDKETGKVYFGFRPGKTDNSGYKAGIIYYDPSTQKLEKYGETTDLILGVTINPNKTKLF